MGLTPIFSAQPFVLQTGSSQKKGPLGLYGKSFYKGILAVPSKDYLRMKTSPWLPQLKIHCTAGRVKGSTLGHHFTCFMTAGQDCSCMDPWGSLAIVCLNQTP